ncbi:MAG: hypothetical protein AB7F86_07105 [Bdellovibrionales bacterium]
MSDSNDNSQPQAPQEIDIDTLAVELVIICKHEKRLSQAGQFLTRRGWPTAVLTDLSKAVELIADKKPDFILISLNHPSPAILKLPELIAQMFNLTCVAFIENVDASSSAALNNISMQYKIQGQPSGPNIHRSIRKFLEERFNIGSDDKKSSPGRKAAENNQGGSYRVKGSAANGPGAIIQKSSSGVTSKGSHLIKGGGQGPGPVGSSKRKRGFGPGEDGDDENDPYNMLTGEGDELSGPYEEGDGYDGDAGLEDESGEQNPSDLSLAGKKRRSLKELTGAQESEDKAGNMLYGRGMQNKPGDDSGADLLGKLKKSLFENADGSTDVPEGASADFDFNSAAASIMASLSEGGPAVGGKKNQTQEDGQSESSGALTGGGGLAEAMAAKASEMLGADFGDLAGKENGQDSSGLTGKSGLPNGPGGSNLAGDLDGKEAREGEGSGHSPGGASSRSGAEGSPSAGSAGESGDDMSELSAASGGAQVLPMRKSSTSTDEKRGIFERAIETAIDRVCSTAPTNNPAPLEETNFVGVFPIDSSVEPGYLVIVWQGNEMQARENFLRECGHSLSEAFSKLNLSATIEPGFWTPLTTVDFLAFSNKMAHFFFTKIHQKRTVAVSFFLSPDPIKRPPLKETDGMVEVSVKDLSPELPVNFKAYIHLKNNQKYVLYLRSGRKIQERQKQRLLDNDVKTIYMKSVEKENFKQYLTVAFLQELVVKFTKAA